MRRTRVAVAALVLVLVGAGVWYLFVPPPTTGTPAHQPFRIEPDVSGATYRVVANRTATCRNATRTRTVTASEVARVDQAARTRRSHRVVTLGNVTYAESVYVNGSERYRRTLGPSESPASPRYERGSTTAPVQVELQQYEPVFPDLLRYEWRTASATSDRAVYRPVSGYWVAPASNYGVRGRVYVDSATGRLVTTDSGTLLDLNLTATTVRANTRFERLFDPRDRCSVHLEYRFRRTRGTVVPPDWLSAARNETA